MTEEAFDPKALLAYATAATPLDTASLWADGQRIGNAADLCAWMIETAHDGTNAGALDVAFASWNLDGDRGYGYRSWSATLPHNWNIDVMGKLSIVLNDPPESPADTNFTAPDGVAVTADADGLLSAADAVHGLAVQAEGLVGGVPVFGADPSIFNDAGNDYRFGMIKAKDEAFVSQRSLADMRIANLVISEANVPASFASYTEQSPTAWRSLLAPRLATDPGAGRNGNIYHMNGVGTPAYDALYERHAVQHFLNLDPSDPTMRVRLVYNVSDPRLPVASLGQNLLAGDALSNQAEIISILDGVQAIRDKIWSFTLLAKVAGVASATEVRDFLTDTTTVPAVTDMRPPLPIRNASTIAVISLLYDAMASGTPLGLCGYSHGTQIIFNAICAFAFRGTQERDYLADRVRVAYFGRMVDVNSVGFLRLLVNDVMDMANPGDPISDILGNIPPDPMFLNAMSAVDIHLELADPTVQVALLEFINSIQADQHQFYRYAPRVRHDSPTLREVFTA